jgi:hypothetical protein
MRIQRAIMGFVALAQLFWMVGCGNRVLAAGIPLQRQVAQGGLISLRPGITNIDCGSQLTITRTTTLVGQGRDVTILNDSCPTGDTIFVDLSNSAVVEIKDLSITHVAGDDIRLIGGTQCCDAVVKRVLRLQSVDLAGATNCLVTDGLNLLFMERSFIHACINDGAQIASFGVTLHDNWIGQNGHNGATFMGGGFCSSCVGNEYWLNAAHGLVYEATAISDPRHIGEYIDSNGDVGLVVNGVRDFTFNDGWIGSNQNGGAIIGDTQLGTVLTGNTFTNNAGPSLILTQTTGPFRITSNVSSLKHSTCDAKLNGTCLDLNTM